MTQLKLNKNEKYLLACSFGPDSMALFHLLRTQGYNFDCAIVNYHLRKESNSEVQGLLNYAAQYNINVFVKDVDKVPQKNIEATCRAIRYSFFKELKDRNDYNAVLVAHHQDDHIETYLMQKDRQICPIYYGIKENTVINGVKIIRPLLDYSKKELIEICHKYNAPYSVDKSNFDVTIKRNKIRHEIVSKLGNHEREELLDKISCENKKLESLFEQLNSINLNDVETILHLDEMAQKYALNELLKNSGISSRLSINNVGQVIDALKSNKPNFFITIKNGVYLVKEYKNFYFLDHKKTSTGYSYFIDHPSQLETPFFFLDFTGDASNRNVKKDDYPLIIRNVNANDIYQIKDYVVKARRLLIDWKVPTTLRNVWPVIINKDNRLIYIPRYREDFKPGNHCNFYVKINK